MNTTLDLIRAKEPCIAGWKKLLHSLGKTTSDNEPLSLLTILESNGLDEALWCLRATPEADSKARLFAVFCARQVQHLNPDPRVAAAIDTAEAFALGKATKEELEAAYYAASSAVFYAAASSAAASSAAYAARSTASSTASSAAYAARSTASVAAYAARSAASAAYYAAAATAAYYAAQQAQTEYFKELFK